MADQPNAEPAPDAAPDPATEQDDSDVQLALLAARTADDKKATDIIILEVGEVLSIAGYFVVCSASNPRLVRTVADEIEAMAKRDLGRAPVRHEGRDQQQWILIDYGDVIVHVFHEDQRAFYEIERLYLDVPKIEWEASR
jgi:ribosome-associated protein